jgi:DNA-binding MarR family transcriptional regulator
MSSELEEDILRSLRRITRAISLHSRKLANTFGLTGPQLVCLRAVGQYGQITPSALSTEVSLSKGTVTGIIDRLLARQLVTRARNPRDRRQVTLAITDAGRALVEQAPSPLQERFIERLSALAAEDQQRIRDTLGEVVRMMDSEAMEAAPVLSTSYAAQYDEEVEMLEAEGGEVTSVSDATPAIEETVPQEKLE